jgi:hypothetical protein
VRFNSLALVLLVLTGCSPERFCTEVDTCWANQKDIKAAAVRCGVPALEPTKAGAAWAAYVPKTVSDHARKEDCIYNDLKRQGFMVTR